MEILRNAIEYIESLEEMVHGSGKLAKLVLPSGGNGASTSNGNSGGATTGMTSSVISGGHGSPSQASILGGSSTPGVQDYMVSTGYCRFYSFRVPDVVFAFASTAVNTL